MKPGDRIAFHLRMATRLLDQAVDEAPGPEGCRAFIARASADECFPAR